MATIATHNGSKVCREHNIRNPRVTEKEKHIDPKRVHEIWHDEKIRKAYQRIFGKAQEDYNRKQTREERKIKKYYTLVEKDAKKHVAYEMIVGVYGKDVSDEMKKEILREFFEDWKRRNPSLELIGAYFHADEQGDIHIHVDYIPVGHGYSRGMAVQNGLNRALEEMGFKTKSAAQTAQIQWERRENQYLEGLCRKRGIEVERPAEEKKQHEEKERYILEKEIGKLRKEFEALKNEIKALREQKGPIGLIGPFKRENEALKKDLASKDDHIKDLERQVESRDIEKAILNERIERMKEAQTEIDDIITREDYKKLQQKYTELEKVNEDLKKLIQEKIPEQYIEVERICNHDKDRS